MSRLLIISLLVLISSCSQDPEGPTLKDHLTRSPWYNTQDTLREWKYIYTPQDSLFIKSWYTVDATYSLTEDSTILVTITNRRYRPYLFEIRKLNYDTLRLKGVDGIETYVHR